MKFVSEVEANAAFLVVLVTGDWSWSLEVGLVLSAGYQWWNIAMRCSSFWVGG
jgi:hypothetical protein